MNVLMLCRYGRLGASSRMRFYQYLPWLEAAGINVLTAPLFKNDYVKGLQQNSRRAAEIIQAYVARVQALLVNKRFDLLWIEKEILPWLPAWVEKVFLPGSVPYVLDYDDAVFHYYDQHRNPLVKAILANKHSVLMRGAALVVVGNDYLAEHAQYAGARRVEVVPTVIDLERYQVTQGILSTDSEKLPCVGWIGQRATASFLEPYKQHFRDLAAEGSARFVAVGINAQELGLPMESIPWAEATEVSSISSFDIGIMPLMDGPFERGKCGYKLIQYMACGIPVIASPVGVNKRIVEHGINGFLADTPEQWRLSLQRLLSDVGLRRKMGQAGRQKVEREYSLQAIWPKLATMLKAAAKSHYGKE